MATRNSVAGSPYNWVGSGLAVLVGAAAVWQGYPGWLAVPLAVCLFGVLPDGKPVVKGSEKKNIVAVNAKRRAGFVLPFDMGVSGLIGVFWVVAAGVGLLTAGWSVSVSAWWWANLVGGVLMVSALARFRRVTVSPPDDAPGVTFLDVFRAPNGWVYVVAALVAGVTVFNLSVNVRVPDVLAGCYVFGRFQQAGLGLVTAGLVLWLAGRWGREDGSDYTVIVKERGFWETGWGMVWGKTGDGIPELKSSRRVGGYTVCRFEAGAATSYSGEVTVRQWRGKLEPVQPKGTTATLMVVPGEPRLFDLIYCENPTLDTLQEVEIGLGWALNIAAETAGMGEQPYVVEIENQGAGGGGGGKRFSLKQFFTRDAPPVTEKPDSSAPFYLVQTGGANTAAYTGTVTNLLNVCCRVDDGETQISGLKGFLQVGEPSDSNVASKSLFAEAISELEGDSLDEKIGAYLHRVDETEEWIRRWGSVQMGTEINATNTPSLQFAVSDKAGPIESRSFMPRDGTRLEKVITAQNEAMMATVLGSAPFCHMSYFYEAPGVRHAQGFTIRWAPARPPASPDQLAGRRWVGKAALWVLAAQLDWAFDTVKFARPDLLAAKNLVGEHSRQAIWDVTIQLRGGVTVGQLLQTAPKLKSALNTATFLPTPVGDGKARIVMGANYMEEGVCLTAGTDRSFLADLSWRAIWSATGVETPNGDMPVLVSAAPIVGNEKVEELVFELPAGLSLPSITSRIDKLKAAAGKTFILPGQVAGEPSQIRLLVADTDPVPFPALPDWCCLDGRPGDIPFATGIDGTPVFWVLKDDPHLMVAGGTGSGKSITASYILAGALAQGYAVCVIDTQKGGADFRMLEPYLSGLATDIYEGAAIMEAIYQVVKERKNQNALAGAQTIDDLPVSERPPRVVVFIDEFTSLVTVGKAPVKPKTDTVEDVRAFQEATAARDAAIKIGMLAGKLGMEARSAGIHLMVGGQKINSEVLSNVPSGSVLRTNMARLLLGKTTFADRQGALRDPGGAPDLGDAPPKGRGVFEPMSGAPLLIQSWYEHPPAETLPAMLAARSLPSRWVLPAVTGEQAKPVLEGDILQVTEDIGVVDLFEDIAPPDLGVPDSFATLFEAVNGPAPDTGNATQILDVRHRGEYNPFG